jgi:hypothetical protein
VWINTKGLMVSGRLMATEKVHITEKEIWEVELKIFL